MARGLKAIVVPGIARLVRRFGRRFDRFMSFLIQSDGGTGRPTLWNRADWIRNKGEGGKNTGQYSSSSYYYKSPLATFGWVIFSGSKTTYTSKIGNSSRIPNLASEIGAICHMFRYIRRNAWGATCGCVLFAPQTKIHMGKVLRKLLPRQMCFRLLFPPGARD